MTVTGFGGNTTGTGSYNDGVYLYYANAQITSSGGAVLVEGTGGGRGHEPLRISACMSTRRERSPAQGTGAGATVTVRGWGGNTGGTSGDYNSGVMLWGTDSRITSNGGAVTVEGTGGGTGNGRGNYGVNVSNPGTITSAGPLAPVTVTGVSSPAATGSDNSGVNISAGRVTSSGGDIAVHGTPGGGVSGFGIQISDSGQIAGTTGTPTVTLTADAMKLLSTTAVDGGAGTVILRPSTPDMRIDLGGADVLTGSLRTLGLTDAELDAVAARTLTIGRVSNSTLSLSAAITRSAATDMNLTSGGPIVFNPGSLDTAGGHLLLSTGVHIEPVSSGIDVTAAGVSFTPGVKLRFPISGTTPDSLYWQLNVAGQIDLTGVSLKLSGTPALVGHETFTIVNNDGIDPIIGELVALPEGAVIINFLGSGRDAAITYFGGDGNDVAITVINAAPVAADDSYSLGEDASLTIVAPGVLGNDSDMDRDVLTALLTAGPNCGTLMLNADGSFTYTPNANFNGADGFTYTCRTVMAAPIWVR